MNSNDLAKLAEMAERFVRGNDARWGQGQFIPFAREVRSIIPGASNSEIEQMLERKRQEYLAGASKPVSGLGTVQDEKTSVPPPVEDITPPPSSPRPKTSTSRRLGVLRSVPAKMQKKLGSTLSAVIAIAILVIHIVVTVSAYHELGAARTTIAVFSFTFLYLLSLIILPVIIALLIIITLAVVGIALYKAGGFEALIGGALMLFIFYLVLALMIFLGPGILAGLAVYAGTESTLIGIIVFVIVTIIWCFLLRIGISVLHSVAAGVIAHCITMYILSAYSVDRFLRDYQPETSRDVLIAIRDASSFFRPLLELISLPHGLMIWLVVLGIGLAIAGKDKDD